MTIPQAFQVAVQHHQAGRLTEAEAIYRQILAVEPRHARALHLLGVLAHQAGRSDLAVDLMQQASALNPDDPEVHSNLGEAYRKLGQWDEAIVEYRRALQIKPDYAEAHSNLGGALAERGQADEAITECRRALHLKPEIAETHYTLGNALNQKGRHDEAIAAYRRALELKPELPAAHFNLGNALRDQDRLDAAIVAYRRALELQPNYVEACGNLGSVLAKQGRFDDAVGAYRLALQFKPAFWEAHNNLGTALSRQGRLDEAIASFGRALELQPDCADAHNNLGNALSQQGQFDEAIASFRRALELRPDFAGAFSNLGNALSNQGRLEEAVACHRRALDLQPGSVEACNNLGNALSSQGRIEEAAAAYGTALRLGPNLAWVHSNVLFNRHYRTDLDAEALFREHCRWDEVHAQPPAKGIERHANDPNSERCLRVGYVSPDFRDHSVAYFLENLLAGHDRGHMEIFCYADLFHTDAVTARLREQAAHWREITGMSHAQVAELVRRDQIDILVDLAGHTAHNRLLVFAQKPAPVQVTWLGYWNTTGLRAMDYRFTDAHADPLGKTEHLHTEQLVRLPETFACFRPWEAAPPVSPLPALPRGQVTFASFHTLHKLNDRLLGWWAEILRQAPGARLLMVAAGLGEASGRQRLREFFGRHDIGAERLAFKGRVPLPEYLALHHEVDVLLDSHPLSGHTVSCHALWMGVPVVTLAGELHCSRMVASVLANVGLPELIAHTPKEYVQIASALTTDLPRLAALRASLRERMASSPLLDGPRFARNVEVAYRQTWRTWCTNRSALSPT